MFASAIRGYRSILSAVFKYHLPDICTSFALRDLICSFELQRPCASVGPPSWDLVKVLEYLHGPVFEPLSSRPLRVFTVKTLVLVPWLRPNGWGSVRPFRIVWCLKVPIFICHIYLNLWAE